MLVYNQLSCGQLYTINMLLEFQTKDNIDNLPCYFRVDISIVVRSTNEPRIPAL